MKIICIACVVVTLIFGSLTAQEKTIASLQQERLDALRQRVKFIEAQLEWGQYPYIQFVHARIDMHEAMLEMATTKEERISALTSLTQDLKDGEEHLTAQEKSGRSVTMDDIFQIRAKRLSAEIRLLREKSESVPDGRDIGRYQISAWAVGTSTDSVHGAYVIDMHNGMVWTIDGRGLPKPLTQVKQ